MSFRRFYRAEVRGRQGSSVVLPVLSGFVTSGGGPARWMPDTSAAGRDSLVRPSTAPTGLSGAEPGRPHRLRICLDADALFAGAASVSGASHVILQLGELGIIEVGVPEQARAEAERNLAARLPAAPPAFQALMDACTVPRDYPTDRIRVSEPGQFLEALSAQLAGSAG